MSEGARNLLYLAPEQQWNSGISALTIICLKVNGMVARAVVDTGCSKTILNQNFLSKNQRKYLNSPKVVTFEGKVHQCI